MKLPQSAVSKNAPPFEKVSPGLLSEPEPAFKTAEKGVWACVEKPGRGMKEFMPMSNQKTTGSSKMLDELQSKNLLTASESLQLKAILETANSSSASRQEIVKEVRDIVDAIINNENASQIAFALARIAEYICTHCATATHKEAKRDTEVPFALAGTNKMHT